MVQTRAMRRGAPPCQQQPLVEALKRELSGLRESLAHERNEYRQNRAVVINHFTSAQGGPVCLTCASKRAVPVMPCTHMVLCAGCVTRVVDCPVCRTRIDEVILQRSTAFRAPLFYLAR